MGIHDFNPAAISVDQKCPAAAAHGETSNVIKRDAKVTRATRAQITSFMRSSLIIFADPFIVILTWNMLIRLLLGFSRNLHPK